MGIWVVYSLLTTLFAHLIGPKPVAGVTNCAAIWHAVSRQRWCDRTVRAALALTRLWVLLMQ